MKFTQVIKLTAAVPEHASCDSPCAAPSDSHKSEVERVWCQGMDQAIIAAGKGLKWTLEGSLLFDVYTRHRTPEKVAQLVQLIKEEKIEIASLYTNIEQENTGPEELVRSTFFANERLPRQYGRMLRP